MSTTMPISSTIPSTIPTTLPRERAANRKKCPVHVRGARDLDGRQHRAYVRGKQDAARLAVSVLIALLRDALENEDRAYRASKDPSADTDLGIRVGVTVGLKEASRAVQRKLAG